MARPLAEKPGVFSSLVPVVRSARAWLFDLPPRPDRLPLIREAFRLEWLTIGWMTIEAIVAIASGLNRKQPCSNRLRP
jgi:hypothetical protein